MRRWRHATSRWRHILRPANFVDVAQEAIEAGLSSKPPPGDITEYHPNCFPLVFRATPIGPLGWLEAGLCLPTYWRSSEAIRPFSMGSSHSTGEKADVFLQCLTTLVMRGDSLSRLDGNLGFRVLGLGIRVQGLGFRD